VNSCSGHIQSNLLEQMMIPPTPPKLRKVRPNLKPANKKDRHTLINSGMYFSNYLSNTLLFIFITGGFFIFIYKLIN